MSDVTRTEGGHSRFSLGPKTISAGTTDPKNQALAEGVQVPMVASRVIKFGVASAILSYSWSQLIFLPSLLTNSTSSKPFLDIISNTAGTNENASPFVSPNDPPPKLPIPYRGPPDGTFNGVPIYQQQKNAEDVQSHIHCVGDNYQANGWKHRSCRYDFICLDTLSHDFVVFQPPGQPIVGAKNFDQRIASERPFIKQSDVLLQEHWKTNRNQNDEEEVEAKQSRKTYSQTVAIGGINQKWGNGPKGIDRLEWSPRVVNLVANTTLRYYELPSEVAWTPLHSLNGENPGHLVWDEFLPVYTLLDMFDLLDHHPLLMRYVLQDQLRGLWASCDFREDKFRACQHMSNKFTPLMWGPNSMFQHTTNIDAHMKLESSQNSDTSADNVHLVCAKTGVAGVGELTDHGITKSHGWEPTDYLTTHNHGRGGELRRFRNYIMRNMGLSGLTLVRQTPHRVVFSINSSSLRGRSIDFQHQVKYVQKMIPNIEVKSVVLSKLTLEEQMELAASATVMVTVCGGAAVTGMFLPEGAGLIIYYSEEGGVVENQRTHEPAMLDWDLLNALTHVRVSWMPRDTRSQPLDAAVLVQEIERAIDRIESTA